MRIINIIIHARQFAQTKCKGCHTGFRRGLCGNNCRQLLAGGELAAFVCRTHVEVTGGCERDGVLLSWQAEHQVVILH